MSERIFIAIASYRDTQLPLTIKSAVENAANPELLDFGVLNQIHLEEDVDCIIQELGRAATVIQKIIDYRESKGACWARAYVWEKLFTSQEFVLQIDSHMRFAKDWDIRLKNLWKSLNDPKAILTQYPPSFDTETEELSPHTYTIFKVKEFRASRLARFDSSGHLPDTAPKLPVKTAFFAGGFSFMKSSAIQEVPYDPYIYFHGEENAMAARFWTHGYNMYLPNEAFTWHDYKNKNKRRRHWEDNPLAWQTANTASEQRCRHLLGVEKSPNREAIKDLQYFGLGFERSLSEYESFSGVSYRYQVVYPHANSGQVLFP